MRKLKKVSIKLIASMIAAIMVTSDLQQENVLRTSLILAAVVLH